MYDSSVKVPTIFTQPGRIPAGTVRPDLLSAYDMAATLLELVGLDPMPMQAGPGRSFAPLVLGRDSGKESQENDVASVVVFDEYGPARMIRTSEWKYVHRWPDGPDELYHLREDPLEERNLVDDPEIASVRRRMSDDLAAWFAKHTRPLRRPAAGRHRYRPGGTGRRCRRVPGSPVGFDLSGEESRGVWPVTDPFPTPYSRKLGSFLESPLIPLPGLNTNDGTR